MNLSIYYFSGTGNAKHVSEWIAEEYRNCNLNTDITDISKLESRKNIANTESPDIAFISPTHGFNFPPIMMHFIFRFPKANNQSVMLINTRAGMKMGKLFLPGLSGIALWLAAIILLIKGYKIKSLHPVDLPSNWISLHPGLKQTVVNSIFDHREKQVRKIANKLLTGKKSMKAFRGLIPDIIISPISVLYYLFGRFALAKTFYASSDCNKCGACIKQCPVNAIKTIDNRPFWTYTCESCMKCMNKCPQRAIETSHGLFTFSILLVYSVIFKILIPEEVLIKFFLSYINNNIAVNIVSVITGISYIAILFSLYYIVHYSMRIKAFETLLIYTSLTKYRFWRRYKGRKDK